MARFGDIFFGYFTDSLKLTTVIKLSPKA